MVTFAEIRYGIERVSDLEQRSVPHLWLANNVRPMFEGRVLSVGDDVMLTWHLLVQEGRKAQHTFSQPTLIVVATALLFNPWVETFALPGGAQAATACRATSKS